MAYKDNFDPNFNVLTDEEFERVLADEKLTYNAKQAHNFCDKSGRHICYRVEYNDYRDLKVISDKRLAIAKAKYESNAENAISKYSKKGVLTVIHMGGDYEPTTEGGVGNYRVRVYIMLNDGTKYMIEFYPLRYGLISYIDENKGMYGEIVYVSQNEANDRIYEDEMSSVIGKYGSANKVPIGKMPKRRGYQYMRSETDIPYTHDGIVEYIKEQFDATFTEVAVDKYYRGVLFDNGFYSKAL